MCLACPENLIPRAYTSLAAGTRGRPVAVLSVLVQENTDAENLESEDGSFMILKMTLQIGFKYKDIS